MSSKRIYQLGIILCLLLSIVSFMQYRLFSDVESNGDKIEVKIINVDCAYSYRTRSHILVEYKGIRQLVRIGTTDCQSLHSGELVSLLYYVENDRIYAMHPDKNSALWGGIGFVFYTIVCIYYLLKQKE